MIVRRCITLELRGRLRTRPCIGSIVPSHSTSRFAHYASGSTAPTLSEVPERMYLEVRGKDAKKFLQGVCTNDVTRLVNRGDCVAAAFLTPKGRVLADALLYNVGAGEDAVLVETPAAVHDPLRKFLAMYKLRSAVQIRQVSARSFIYDGDADQLREYTQSNDLLVVGPDPRAAELGARALFLSNQTSQLPASLSNILSTTSQYRRIRLLAGLCEGSEIVNRIPLECNLDLLRYISFEKGCYVGQELVARTKHKGLVRKRILPFVFSSLGQPGQRTSFTPLADAVRSQLLGPIVAPVTPAPLSTAASSEPGVILGAKLHIKGENSSILNDDSSCGEVVAVDATPPSDAVLGVGAAMVYLDRVYPAPSSNTCFLVASANEGEPIGLAGVFRPLWWPDVDAVTGKRMDDIGPAQ